MVAIALFSSLPGDQEPTAIARVILGDPKGGSGDTPLPERPSLGIASKPDEGQTLGKLFPKPLTDRCAGMGPKPVRWFTVTGKIFGHSAGAAQKRKAPQSEG